MRIAACVHSTILGAIVLLMLITPANAQLTVEWERMIWGEQGIAVGDITQLSNNNYLLSYTAGIYPNYNSYLSEIGSNGFEFINVHQPDSLDATYLESVGINQVLSLANTVGSSPSALCILSYPDGITLISDYIDGYITMPHPYILGGYIAGSFNVFEPNIHYISRINNSGSVLWSIERSIGDVNSVTDVCSNIVGHIYIPISGYPNLFIEKFDHTGNLLEEYSYPSHRYVHHINVLPDGNLFLSESDVYGDGHFSGLIINPDGDLLHEYTIPEIGSMRDIWLMPDGGYLTTSFQDYNAPDLGFLLTRFDASYSQLWQYTYDNSSQYYESLDEYDVLIDRNGDIILFGNPYYYNTDDKHEFVFLSKFTPDPTDLEIAVHPYGDVSAVPAPGRFFWHGTLTNNTDADITTDVWVIVRGPDGYPSEPLRVWDDITVPANGTYEADLRQNVSADAANGEYNYILRAGTYEPGDPQHTIQAYFPLTVTGGTEVNLDPPRTRGVVAAPFDGPVIAAQTE